MRLGNSNIVLNRAIRKNEVDVNDSATYKGIFIKSVIFLVVTFLGVGLSYLLLNYDIGLLMMLLLFGSIATVVTGIISFLSVRACKVTGSIYCFFEGLTIGTISILISEVLEGAVAAAILGTLATVAVVVFLFMSRIIKVGNGFLKFLLIFAISLFLTQLLFRFYIFIIGGTYSLNIQIVFSILSSFLATLYLFFDLRNIERVVENHLSKKYEWYVSFGIIYTVLWLYVEILRIVVLFAGRRK